MWRVQSSVVGLLVACLMSSCAPVSKHPLSAPDTARHDKRLTGVWVGRFPDDDTVLWFHFVETKDSLTEIAMIAAGEGETEVVFLRMHPTTVGKHTYMNLKPHVPEEYATADMAKEIEASDYALAKYEVSDDTLKVWLMVGGIDDAIEQGELEGTVVKEIGGTGDVTVTDTPEKIERSFTSDVTITDTPEKIGEFLQKADHAEVFVLFLVCRKVKVEPPVVEDSEEE